MLLLVAAVYLAIIILADAALNVMLFLVVVV
jgi:hypothetical protein